MVNAHNLKRKAHTEHISYLRAHPTGTKKLVFVVALSIPTAKLLTRGEMSSFQIHLKLR